MMWHQMSLRLRLITILAGLYGFAMAVGFAALLVMGPAHIKEEEENIDRLTGQFMHAALAVIEQAPNPEANFRIFLESLRTRSDHIFSFRPAGLPAIDHDETGEKVEVPNWFAKLIRPPGPLMEIPVIIGERALGHILFRANLSADINEKWWALWAFVVLAAGMALGSIGFAYLVIGRSLRPLAQIENALSRLKSGDYSVRISCAGPPELAKGCRELNELAGTLGMLTEEKAVLMRRIVTVQDEERRDIARELHDELGPLLFAIRANASAVQKSQPTGSSSMAQMLAAVEALQQTNRRILDKLRPMHFREIGLLRSLQSLLSNWGDSDPARDISLNVDPEVESADESILLTIYRTVQEALTNAIRHSRASRIAVAVQRRDSRDSGGGGAVVISISDNGTGIPAGTHFGRGLTGMQERLRALGGTLNVKSRAGDTSIQGTLPFSRSPG